MQRIALPGGRVARKRDAVHLIEAASGELPVIRIGRRVLIAHRDGEEFLQRHRAAIRRSCSQAPKGGVA